MARLGFDADDPTFGIPGVSREADDEVSFESEAAARKWFALRRALEAQHRLRRELDQKRRQLAEARAALAAADDGSDAQALAQIGVDNLQAKIDDLEARLAAGDGALDEALAAARACRVDDTVAHAGRARIGYATGVDTGGPILGLPVPGEDENAAGVDGPDGLVWIRFDDKDKFPALREALERIANAEAALLALLLLLELARGRLEAARARLTEIEARLKAARARVEALRALDPYSREGRRALERAEGALLDLEAALEAARDAVEAAEETLAERLREAEARARALTRALRDAYRRLRRMYAHALACDAERTQREGERIGGLLGPLIAAPAGGPGGGNDGGNGADEVDEAEEAVEEAGARAEAFDEATGEGTEAEIGASERVYFEGLYESLLANYRRRREHAPHSVNDYLALRGETCREIIRWICGEGANARTVIIKLKWDFGDTPRPIKDKPEPPAGEEPEDAGTEEGADETGDEDGRNSIRLAEFETQNNRRTFILCFAGRVDLLWVRPYDEVASNKALLYHEFLHGQLCIEWFRSDAARAAYCAWAQAGGRGAIPLDDDDHHDRINPWQEEFQEAIGELEQQALEAAEQGGD